MEKVIIPIKEAGSVPCNGCSICCQEDAIFLHPEHGDDESLYETEQFMGRTILKHKHNGNCFYLTESGCGIYDKRPAICREFDCRQFVRNLGYTKARKLVKKGAIQSGLVQRGIILLKEMK